MRSCYFFICITLLLFSCHKKQSVINVSTNEEMLNQGYDLPLVSYNFEGEASIDTLSIDNIIKSVELIPLETNDNSLVDMVIDVEPINDYYVVKHGKNLLNFQIAVFNKEGKFVRNLYNLGRGPNEITQTLNSFCIESTNDVMIMGMDKILICNVETGSISHYRPYESADGTISVGKFAPLPDGTIACLNAVKNKKNETHPFLIIFDSNLKPIKYYSDDKIRYSERSDGPVLVSALTRSPNGALYRDILNDTVFSVRGKDAINPAFVLDVPSKNRPQIANESSSERKKVKYYYHDIFYPFESENYIFDGYSFDNKEYNVIWKKGLPKPLYKTSSDRSGYWIKVDDLTLFCNMHSCINNQIITTIPWFLASRFIDDIQPDSNPVLLKITLR